jgi:hypothetical protein
VSKRRAPLLLIAILFFSFVLWHGTGLLVASLVSLAAYLGSVKLNPRINCERCKGAGRYTGWIFTWVWHKCLRCGGTGQKIRWGASQWGQQHAQREAFTRITRRGTYTR